MLNFARNFLTRHIIYNIQSMDKVSYALGLGIARQLAGMGASEVNVDDFAQALKDIFLSEQ